MKRIREGETSFKGHVDGRGRVNVISSWRLSWQKYISTYCVSGRKLLFIETECSMNDE